MEEPVQIPSGADTLCGMLYRPAAECRCGLVMCHPLFEERKSAHRVMVDAARALAASGCAVLRFDYRGCGDSTGDFAAFSCPDWQEDIVQATRYLREQVTLERLGLLGLRLGASLAVGAANDAGADFAVLWEPVLNGRRYLDQELRRKLVREMVTFGKSQVTRATLLKDLENGTPIDLDGYAVTARLFSDTSAIDLTRGAGQAPRRTLLVQIAPTGVVPRELTGLKDALLAGGNGVDLLSVPEDPFWNLVGLVSCPSLIDATRAWLMKEQGETPRGMATACTAGTTLPADAGRRSAQPAPEHPVAWHVDRDVLQGIVHEPEPAGTGPLVVFLHGWAGSRIGPHRMFVHMARRLTARGCVCVRFDFRGRGDSDGEASRASIRSMIADTSAALDFAVPRYPGRDVILLAICSGCKVAIGTTVSDPRVGGLALWSPEPMGPLRDATSKNRKSTHALLLYGRKLLRPETWRKLLTFRVNMRMVKKAVGAKEVAGGGEIRDETEWLNRLRAYKGRALLIHGSNDPETETAKTGYASFCARSNIPHESHVIAGANHSFYGLAWEREVMDLTEAWMVGKSLTQVR